MAVLWQNSGKEDVPDEEVKVHGPQNADAFTRFLPILPLYQPLVPLSKVFRLLTRLAAWADDLLTY